MDGSDRTLICVVVVPSIGAALGRGDDGVRVAVGGSVCVTGNVAVTKSVVDMGFSLVMFNPQPVEKIIVAENRIMLLRCTRLLYPRIMLRVMR